MIKFLIADYRVSKNNFFPILAYENNQNPFILDTLYSYDWVKKENKMECFNSIFSDIVMRYKDTFE